jgi:hypothetical protein
MQLPSDDPAIKKSVSIPQSLYRKAIARAKSLGYNLSQYIQHLIRNDLQRGGDQIPRIAEKPERVYRASKDMKRF